MICFLSLFLFVRNSAPPDKPLFNQNIALIGKLKKSKVLIYCIHRDYMSCDFQYSMNSYITKSKGAVIFNFLGVEGLYIEA